jgi:hypothetical protein
MFAEKKKHFSPQRIAGTVFGAGFVCPALHSTDAMLFVFIPLDNE